MRKAFFAAAILVGMQCLLVAASHAGQIDPSFASYLHTLGESDNASAIVYLQDQPDIKQLDDALHIERAPMNVRHMRVIEALRDAAVRSQPNLLAYLESRKLAGAI